MKHLSSLVADRLKKHHLSKEAYASLILEKTKQIIESHFGDLGLENLIPKKYQNGKVYIVSSGSTWKKECFMHKISFCTLLQLDFPNDPIQEIIVL